MKLIATDKAPAAIGPYAQAVQAGDFVFTSGQLGIDPRTKQLKGATTAEQAGQALENLRFILKKAGCDFAQVVETTVYLVDLKDFAEFNALYEQALQDHKPARATVQVAALPLGARIEIKMTAVVK